MFINEQNVCEAFHSSIDEWSLFMFFVTNLQLLYNFMFTSIASVMDKHNVCMVFYTSINEWNILISIVINLQLMHYQIISLLLMDFVNGIMLQLEFD